MLVQPKGGFLDVTGANCKENYLINHYLHILIFIEAPFIALAFKKKCLRIVDIFCL